MKTTAFLFGTGSVIVLALGLLFKFHHWPAANFISVLGMFLFVVSLPVIGVYLSKINSKYKNTYMYWAIATFILVVGIVFKLNHYSGALIIQSIGTGLFILFTILFSLKLFKSEQG